MEMPCTPNLMIGVPSQDTEIKAFEIVVRLRVGGVQDTMVAVILRNATGPYSWCFLHPPKQATVIDIEVSPLYSSKKQLRWTGDQNAWQKQSR